MITNNLPDPRSLLEDIEYIYTHPGFAISESKPGDASDDLEESKTGVGRAIEGGTLSVVCSKGPKYLVMRDIRREQGKQYFVAIQTPIPETMEKLRRLSLAAHALNLFDECVLLHPRTQFLLSQGDSGSDGAMPEHLKWALERLRERLEVLALQNGSEVESRQRLQVSIA